MEYLIGVILTLAVAAFAFVVGFDREASILSNSVDRYRVLLCPIRCDRSFYAHADHRKRRCRRFHVIWRSGLQAELLASGGCSCRSRRL